jgi:hypothetical protein
MQQPVAAGSEHRSLPDVAALHSRLMRTRLIAIAAHLAALALAPEALASPPRFKVFGLELGIPPAAAASILDLDYKACRADRSIYHAVAGDPAEKIAALSINPGLTFNDIGAADICASSPAGDGITDSIEARFVHPEIDTAQPLYGAYAKRLYPDVVYASPAKLRNSFDAIRAELMRLYGRPIDERREQISSSAANLAASLGIGRQVKREDYLVRYLWAGNGRLLDQEFEDSSCNCSGRYVKAIIEISRSPSTIPKNRFYVLSVQISVEDSALKARQDEWNAQWQRTKN